MIIDIKGLPKWKLLQALYNNGRPIGMGLLHHRPGDLSDSDAQAIIGDPVDHDYSFKGFPPTMRKELYFDYLNGRPLKANITGDEFNSAGYDRDNGGDGTAARLIATVRAEFDANSLDG